MAGGQLEQLPDLLTAEPAGYLSSDLTPDFPRVIRYVTPDEEVAVPRMIRSIRVRPGASRTDVGGSYGEGELVVRVSSPAVDGRATEAALRAVAQALGVSASRVRLESGVTSRTKRIALEAPEAELLDLARVWEELLKA